MSIIQHATLQKIVAHDIRYDPRTCNLTVHYFPPSCVLSKRILTEVYTIIILLLVLCK